MDFANDLMQKGFTFDIVNDKTYYKCLFCNVTINDYNLKYINQRYRTYGAIGCKKCNFNRKRNDLMNSIHSNYTIITEQQHIKNVQRTKTHIKNNMCGHEFITVIGYLKKDGSTCPVCKKENRKNTKFVYRNGEIVKKLNYSKEKILELISIRNIQNKGKELKVLNIDEYKGMLHPLQYKCNKCKHVWQCNVSNILNNDSGCPVCSKTFYSKKSIKWLNSIMNVEDIFIQHAENIGEFPIYVDNSKRYYVDGFCKKTNTVYEFNGSLFHGDPAKFKPDDKCHPYNKEVTAYELYEMTLQKEEDLKNLGYSVVSIWESEYDKLSINKL